MARRMHQVMIANERATIHENEDRALSILRGLGQRYGIDWGLPKPKRFSW